MWSCSWKGNIEWLYSSHPLFKPLSLWIQACTEYFWSDVLFPVMWQPAHTKFNHKIFKEKGCESFAVDRDPVVDEIILKTSEYAQYLQVVINTTFGIDEVIEAVIFKVFYRLWRDFSIRKLRWSSDCQVNTCCILLVCHCRRRWKLVRAVQGRTRGGQERAHGWWSRWMYACEVRWIGNRWMYAHNKRGVTFRWMYACNRRGIELFWKQLILQMANSLR